MMGLCNMIAGRRKAALSQLAFTDTGISLDNRITFTRSTPANDYGPTGTLRQIAIDVARANANQDYNPSTLAARGFLIEAGATNLFLRSQELDNATWTKTRSSITANAIAAPDGTTTADKLVEDTTAANNHYTFQLATIATTTVYTWTIFAKAGERTWLGMSAYDGSTRLTFFNLANGTIGTNAAGNAAAIQALPNGWYRCTITRTTAATTTGAIECYLAEADNDITYTGDGTSGLYLWGAQLEANAFATSYVKSEGSATARGVDLPQVATLSSIGYNSTQGALSGQVMFEGVGRSNTRRIASFNDGTTNNEIAIVMADGGSDLIRFLVTSGGVTQADISSTVTAVANTLYKWAISWNANSFRISVNSTAGTEVTTGTVPTVDRLTIGTDGAGANSVNGWEPSITYYPMQLAQAQMNQITT